MATINNSNGKILLGNWVEERGSAPFEDSEIGIASLGTQGHKGILTTKFDANAEKLTTVRDSYRKPDKVEYVTKEAKENNLKKHFLRKSDYVHEEIEPVMHHNYEIEQPTTFWSEHYKHVHSVSQTKTSDTPFRKNAAFSTPISEYTDSPKPYENWKF